MDLADFEFMRDTVIIRQGMSAQSDYLDSNKSFDPVVQSNDSIELLTPCVSLDDCRDAYEDDDYHFILDTPGISFEQVLLHPGFLNAYANYNRRILSYLTEPKHILKMIEIICQPEKISLPTENRYERINTSATACNNITCVIEGLFHHEISNVRLAFSENTEAIKVLCNFVLDPNSFKFEKSLDTALRIISYVQDEPTVVRVLAANENLVGFLLRKVEELRIRDFFLNFFNVNARMAASAEMDMALDRQKLIQRVLGAFLGSEPERVLTMEYRITLGDLLCQLMYLLRWKEARRCHFDPPVQALITTLENASVLDLVTNAITNAGANRDTEMLPYFFGFLRNLLFNAVYNDLSVRLPSLPTNQSLGQDGFVAKGATRHYKRLSPFLVFLRSTLNLNDSWKGDVDAEEAQKPPPLGVVRLHAVRFLCLLVFHARPAHAALFDAIVQQDFVGAFIELFFTYKWNSLLHCSVDFFVRLILRRAFNPVASLASPVTDNASTGGSPGPTLIPSTNPANASSTPQTLTPYGKMLHQLLVGHKFLERLLAEWNLYSATKGDRKASKRPGYMGHLESMAAHLAVYLFPSLTGQESDFPELWDDANLDLPDFVAPRAQAFDPEELRATVLNDIPPPALEAFMEFVKGDLLKALSTSNVMKFRALRFMFSVDSNQAQRELVVEPSMAEAALKEYHSYRNRHGFPDNDKQLFGDSAEVVFGSPTKDSTNGNCGALPSPPCKQTEADVNGVEVELEEESPYSKCDWLRTDPFGDMEDSAQVDEDTEAQGMAFFQSALSPILKRSPERALKEKGKVGESEDFVKVDLDGEPAVGENGQGGVGGQGGAGEKADGNLMVDLRSKLCLVPDPKPSEGPPSVSESQSRRRFLSLRTDSGSPDGEGCLGVVYSSDLPDCDSLVLPRFLLGGAPSSVIPKPPSQVTDLPKPIQPTIRIHSFSRTPLSSDKPDRFESESSQSV